jgi:pilus assembly protein CpaF
MPTKPFPEQYEELKQLMHKELVVGLDPSRVRGLTGDVLRGEIRVVIERLVDRKNLPLNRMDRERLINDVLNMALGPRPINPAERGNAAAADAKD